MCQGEGTAERKRTPIRVLIIIPALNESATLPDVLQGLRNVLPEFDVVVIDDGSTDDTAAVARANGAVVLQLPFNLGIGGALRTGFRYAVAHDYDAGVQLDADGQHDPEMITRLLDALDQADFVIGSRFASATSYEVGRTRRSAMKVLQLAMRLLSGRSFSDTSSGFRAFGRPVLQFFAQSYPSEYMESVEALLAANYAGFRIAEVPVQMHQRAGGTPSAVRIKLLYHYVRVVFTMLTRVQRRPALPRSPGGDVK
ncbi:MAG: glycosyltransferase family 2 protein [Microthrixaceae bacterium]